MRRTVLIIGQQSYHGYKHHINKYNILLLNDLHVKDLMKTVIEKKDR